MRHRITALVVTFVLGTALLGAASASATVFTPGHLYSSSVSSLFHGRSVTSQQGFFFNMVGYVADITCTTAQFDGITPTTNRTATAFTFTPRYPAPGGAGCLYGPVGGPTGPAFVTAGCDWTITLQSYENVGGSLQTSAFDTGNGGCSAAMTISAPTMTSCTFTIPVQTVGALFSGQDRRSNDTADATGPTATGSRFTATGGVTLGFTSNCFTGTRTMQLYTDMAIGPQTGHLTDVGLWGGP
ncbi:MAG TPA: hypothetical protein VI318_18045 [Baekduia sp.]